MYLLNDFGHLKLLFYHKFDRIFSTCNINVSDKLTSYKTNKVLSGQQGNVRIYPNPVKDLLNLEFQSCPENMMLHIYQSTGKLFYSSPFTSNTQNLQVQLPGYLKSGIYILRINQGENVQTERFVLSR